MKKINRSEDQMASRRFSKIFGKDYRINHTFDDPPWLV